jgi:hypothetical protein
MMRFCILLVTLFLTLGIAGCGPSENPKDTADSGNLNAQPELTGADVLNGMFQAYAGANSYSDKAVLYMTYRTEDGRPMQEPMPWAVSFEKPSGNFSGRLFDSVVKYDGSLLGCRVFDIESDNQDNQFLLIAGTKLPFNELLRDKLAKRFVGGFEEIPLRSDSNALVSALLPPTIKLLTGQADFPWFTQPDAVQRLDDQTIEGVICFHVQSSYRNQLCDLWIEQETGLIHQLLVPNTIFTDDVAKTNRIQDLKVVARFHNCEFNTDIAASEFSVEPPEGASLVREFVTLPEAFPSELIGRQTPKFTLKTPQGKSVVNQDFSGKPTAFLWIAGFGASEGIQKFDEFSKRFGNQVNLAVLYSDAEMKDPSGSTFALSEAFLQSANVASLNVPFLCDHHLDVSSLMQIKAIPSVLIFDETQKIQYARALSGDEWASEAEAAIQRIARGEDIAQEMIDEYGKFYSAYRAKLNSVAFDRKSIAAQTVAAKLPRTQSAKPVWENDTLLQPGNIATQMVDGKNRIAILDGYRTVVLLDENGKQLLRKELELPENQAVTRIRLSDFDGNLMVAAFSKLGSQVHWFDENLNRVGSFPLTVKPGEKVADCQFAKSGQSLGLIVSLKDKGIFQVDLATGKRRKMSDQLTDEFTVVGSLLGGVNDGVPFLNALPDLNPNAFEGWHLSELSGKSEVGGDKESFCAIGLIGGKYQALGLDSRFSIQWKAYVGEQEFDNDIESLATNQSDRIWAIASSDYGVSVINGMGELVHLIRTDSQPSGIGSFASSQRPRIVFSDGRVVKCVELTGGR